MITAEQAKHYGDIAAYGVGGASSIAFWLEAAKNGTVFLTFIGALLSVAWISWRLIDRARFGPSHLRNSDD